MTHRPLVHIGMPKCASTWLQKHYFNRAHGFTPLFNTTQAYMAFVAARSFDWTDPKPLADIDDSEGLVPLVSLEGLVGKPLIGGANGEVNMYRLLASLPQARILLVIREQRAMLRSMYQLLVNWGYPYPIEQVVENRLPVNIPGFEPAFLCYERAIAAYQKHFGEDAVLVLPMEMFQTEPLAFLGKIGAFCGIDLQRYPVTADVARKENEKRSLVSLELKRLYNSCLAKTRLSPFGLYTPDNIQGAGNVNPSLPGWLNQRLEMRFSNRLNRLIDGRFSASNARTEALTGLSLGQYGYQLPGG
ncbi:MAG: hypothetical protein AAGA91_19070 [Pseudomonadota bacterium]